MLSKIECGRGQPPQPHLTWIPALPFSSPLGGGMTASARQRSQWSAAFAKAKFRFAILRSRTQPLQWPATLLALSNMPGEEAATPGQPARARARVLDIPR